MKKYEKSDQKLLADWSLNCAERVLHFFEQAAPGDTRPRHALETGRDWVRTGVFEMALIRGKSLAAHAAAREIKSDAAASFAARACGQAVATAHVAQHAYGGVYYALKALAAANPENAEQLVATELEWQSSHLADNLRGEIMSRIIVEKRRNGLFISIRKGADF